MTNEVFRLQTPGEHASYTQQTHFIINMACVISQMIVQNIWQRCDKLAKLVVNICRYHMLRGLVPIFLSVGIIMNCIIYNISIY